METRAILLKQLTETVLKLIDVYENTVDPDRVVYEGWTAKQVLGHITFWHESFARNVRDIANDIQPTPLKGKYSDLNQRCFEEIKTQTVDDVLSRLQAAHRVIEGNILNAKVQIIPYKKGSRDYTPEEHLDLVIKHIQAHLRDIKAL
ncbi:MAG: ClbS/DfsB family four-helix bundle protein [Anaerolineaceae bacterium]|nr:ClbS/DfsB family four-helix bundle protein [Anaerolineaceae bacterium]